MAEIDQLSEIIGKLNAEVAENQRQNTALFRKLDAIEEKITKMAGAVEMVASKQMELEADVKENINPVVADYKAMKNRGIGVIAFIGLASGGVGAALAKFVPQ